MMDHPRPLGIFNQMWGQAGVADATILNTAIEEMVLAEALGFASIWIGEHHLPPGTGGFYGRVPAAEVFLGHLSGRLRRIGLGTGVKLFATDARRAAEEMMTLNLLAPDRVEFGIGQGPTLPDSTETRTEKALRFRAQMTALLDHLRGVVRVGEKPLSLAPAPDLAQRIWVAARDDASIDFAAAQGLNFVVGQAENGIAQSRFVQRYRAAGGRGEARGVRLVFVAETRAEAEAECAEATELYFGLLGYKGYHADGITAGLLPETADSPAEKRRQVDFLAGTPDDVAQMLNDHIALTGIDRLDVMPQLPGIRTEAVARSLRLIATEVRPRLRFPEKREAA
ncbi:LLM class flavin-dependent oxidoreductase [Acidisoma cellulosilytica]|uniref:LLM class flavin-dependent oxidoreductase n=1 Tax=Acidisoma cellulosilyticum TaxID=2802395 RepID=A0A963Z2J9_9PROT|nr:LLM class flavin-dependent oxidoreductase [Acidisoma cellulosilyticum]MCB8881590.1 LLM class flavin-dependent oxidoreductase [Acidisoma cellulosilyticum]